ncbi:hypothetical protein KIW84_046284 [Lathyrus oleraceus]|uniref:Uncharacterized protein n=1 Tax=Pisum sativum TaxID=3888 RepID=A0A9D4XR47_PEA|nr:hypothetical protein KIW84_046284 [Pisum sativum]
MDTAYLLYLIMSGKRIDVAQIIANEMRHVAESGKEFRIGTRSTCPLIFPDLIMGLLIASRGEAVGSHRNGNENDEEDAEAEEEEEEEEGTSGGSKIASDDDAASDDD